MIYRSLWPVLALTCLSACSNSEPLDSGTEAEVKAYFANDRTSSHLRVASSWRADAIATSTVCGKMAPDADGAEPRFVYDPQGKYGQVSLPSGTIGENDATDTLIAKNREIFDDLWRKHCAPFAPA